MTRNYGDTHVTHRGHALGGRISRSSIGRTLIMALLLLLLASCSARGRAQTADAPLLGATVNDIVGDANRYIGKTVTVSGEINDVLGPRAFTIGGEEFYGGGELLIVGAKDFPAIPNRPANEYLVDDDIVQATGVVRKFVRADVEKEIGVDLNDALFDEWEGKPALVIRGLYVTPRLKPAAAGASGAARPAAGAAGTTGAMADPIPDILIIVTAPDRPSLVGRRVQLTSVPVQSVVGNKTFWVGPSEKQRLFVVLGEERTAGTATEGKVDVNAGQTVTLTGVVRKLPGMEAARKRWGLSAQQADGLKNEAIYLAAERVQTGKASTEMKNETKKDRKR